SVKYPARFFDNNVAGAISVLTAAQAANVESFVFSSTCAVYGAPQYTPLDEAHPFAPMSPYGRSKLIVDQMLAELSAYTPFRYISLRYFNAAGADPDGDIGERHQPESHALPLAIHTALGRRSHFSIFGQDYDTADGTAVRDYIHVNDLAAAHVAAINALTTDRSSQTFNLGAGAGTSVRELVNTVKRLSEREFEVREEARRPGDPPILVANNFKVRAGLNWAPRFSFEDTVRTAIAWHQEHEPRIFGAA
ncbi:MAG: UDP-glucose 4-epimerase GalE, partial [Caulobacterales bacterium]